MLTDLWEVIEKHATVGLLQLVLNYDSFAQTVENLFQVSFLVWCSGPECLGMVRHGMRMRR